MSGDTPRSRKGGRRDSPLSGTIISMVCSDSGAEIVVRLTNSGTRAAHYIRDIRTVRYDLATRRLVLGLSDEGSLIQSASVHPAFSYIDPGSAAELKLVLPPRYVRLAPQAAPSGELLFEQFRAADAGEIVIEVAWADTPFYEDPRGDSEGRSPIEAWAQGKAVMSYVAPRQDEPAGPGSERKPDAESKRPN